MELKNTNAIFEPLSDENKKVYKEEGLIYNENGDEFYHSRLVADATKNYSIVGSKYCEDMAISLEEFEVNCIDGEAWLLRQFKGFANVETTVFYRVETMVCGAIHNENVKWFTELTEAIEHYTKLKNFMDSLPAYKG